MPAEPSCPCCAESGDTEAGPCACSGDSVQPSGQRVCRVCGKRTPARREACIRCHQQTPPSIDEPCRACGERVAVRFIKKRRWLRDGLAILVGLTASFGLHFGYFVYTVLPVSTTEYYRHHTGFHFAQRDGKYAVWCAYPSGEQRIEWRWLDQIDHLTDHSKPCTPLSDAALSTYNRERILKVAYPAIYGSVALLFVLCAVLFAGRRGRWVLQCAACDAQRGLTEPAQEGAGAR